MRRFDRDYYGWLEWEKGGHGHRRRPSREPSRAAKERDKSHIEPIRELLKVNPNPSLANTLEYLREKGIAADPGDVEFTLWLERRGAEIPGTKIALTLVVLGLFVVHFALSLLM